MVDKRKAIHAYLTPDGHDAWHDYAAENGVSVSALLEALAADLRARVDRGTEDPILLAELTRSARKIDAARRRRQAPS